MAFIRRVTACILLASSVSGCIRTVPTYLPTNDAAYQAISKGVPTALPADYPIQAGDKIRISVFQEPDLSADEVLVDPAGNISLPLLGQIHAAGTTPARLGSQLQSAYGARYLRNPQVSIGMVEAVQRVASVEGEVKQPGQYPVSPDATLLAMLAQARSPTTTAKLSEVLIFRTVDGQRMGGRFDAAMIRAGRAEDPRILPGDLIVVGYSRVQGGYRDLLQAVPLFSVFARY